MGAERTPGPWSWVKRDGEYAFLRFEHPDGGVQYVLSPETEVFDYGLSSCEWMDVSDADARLIAAAPELYDALRCALDALEAVADLGHRQPERALEAARAAITKAEAA